MKPKKLLAALISLCIILSAFPAFTAFAAEDNPGMGSCGKDGDNVTYVYQDGTLTIAGTGEMADYEKYSDNETPWEDIKKFIKTVVVQEGVTRIGSDAFGFCYKLQSVTLPEGILSIGDDAFSGTYSLTSIILPESLETLGSYAFGGSFIENITVPSKVKDIPPTAFMSCDQLVSVALPEGLETIGNSAFYCCKALTGITLPAGLKKVGSHVFASCESLKEIVLPDQIEAMDYGVFDGCTVLEKVVLPKNLTDIYDSMFLGCSALSEINIPESVTYIGDLSFSRSGIKKLGISAGVSYIEPSAFYNCDALESITIDGKNENYTVVDNSLYTKDMTAIVHYVGSKGQTSFKLPDSVTRVCDSAFSSANELLNLDISSAYQLDYNAVSGCKSLKSVKLSERLIEIPSSCFQSCTSLESIDIPKGVKAINSSAFYACESLVSVTLQEGLEKIDDSAFSICQRLKSINIPSTVTEVGWNIIGNTAIYNSLPLENGVRYLDGWAVDVSVSDNVAFKEGTVGISRQILGAHPETVFIPKTVKYISNGGLQGASFSKSVKSYTVDPENPYFLSEDGVVYTKDKTELVAYPQNGGIIKYTVPEGVKTIRDCAFYNTNIEQIEFPDSLEYIGNRAFYYSTGLKSALLKENVKFIGDMAFGNCSNVDLGEIPSGLEHIGYMIFDMSRNAGTTKVDGNTYLGNWLINASVPDSTEFKIADGTVGIASSSIYTVGGVRASSVYIPASVKNINSRAFKYFINLKDVYFAGSKQEWCKINIGDENAPLLEAHIHFADQTPLYGDVNDDGEVTASDALMTLQNFVGSRQFTDEQMKVADVDGVDGITAKDALLILQYAVKILDKFPIEMMEIA